VQATAPSRSHPARRSTPPGRLHQAREIEDCIVRMRQSQKIGLESYPVGGRECEQGLLRCHNIRYPMAATKQPDGQIFTFAVGQIIARTPAILSPRKGRWPSSPNVGMGLRWTRRCRA